MKNIKFLLYLTTFLLIACSSEKEKKLSTDLMVQKLNGNVKSFTEYTFKTYNESILLDTCAFVKIEFDDMGYWTLETRKLNANEYRTKTVERNKEKLPVKQITRNTNGNIVQTETYTYHKNKPKTIQRNFGNQITFWEYIYDENDSLVEITQSVDGNNKGKRIYSYKIKGNELITEEEIYFNSDNKSQVQIHTVNPSLNTQYLNVQLYNPNMVQGPARQGPQSILEVNESGHLIRMESIGIHGKSTVTTISYEKDHSNNWIRRDMTRDGKVISTQIRVIEYYSE